MIPKKQMQSQIRSEDEEEAAAAVVVDVGGLESEGCSGSFSSSLLS